MARFEVFTGNDEARWENFIAKFSPDQQDIYFSARNYKLYNAYGDGETQCIAFEKDGKQALYPYLINTVNNLGYNLPEVYYDIQGAYGYNGVLTNSFDEDFIVDFYKEFSAYCNEKKIIAEFTRFHPVLGNNRFSAGHMEVIRDRETVSLCLDQPYESIWVDSYSSKNRNMIRKAQKLNYNAAFVTNPSAEQIDVFYGVYLNSMTNVQADKYYFFNEDYFHNMFSFFADNIVLLNISNNAGEVACSSVFFNTGYYFHYHLSGRSGTADNSVNNFLLDEAIKYAQLQNAKVFHFGGGRSNSEDDSLLKFKTSFSKDTKEFFIGKKVHNEGIYREVVKQWEEKYPEKKEAYKNHILKYRSINE